MLSDKKGGGSFKQSAKSQMMKQSAVTSAQSSSSHSQSQQPQSRITKFGERTADGRPLERISTRPMTPVQPLVAEMKESDTQQDEDRAVVGDFNQSASSQYNKPRHQLSSDSDLDDQDDLLTGNVMQSMRSATSNYKRGGGSGGVVGGTGSGKGNSPVNLYNTSPRNQDMSIHYSSPVKFSSNSPLKVSSIECPNRQGNSTHSGQHTRDTNSPRSNVMAAFAKLDPKFSSPTYFMGSKVSSPRSSKRPEELIAGEDDVDELVSTIFLISDDERLKVFGTTYCFNGRDSFKLVPFVPCLICTLYVFTQSVSLSLSPLVLFSICL